MAANVMVSVIMNDAMRSGNDQLAMKLGDVCEALCESLDLVKDPASSVGIEIIPNITAEKCPVCGSTEFLVARDMKATRHCARCHHEWTPPPKVVGP